MRIRIEVVVDPADPNPPARTPAALAHQWTQGRALLPGLAEQVRGDDAKAAHLTRHRAADKR